MARASPPRSGPTAADAVEAALDELYAAPFDGFVEARRVLAAGLRASGDVASARRVVAAPKPTRSAWAVNQVARRDAQRIRDVLAAWDEAAAAQAGGDAGEVRARSRAFRARIADVVQAARDILEESGSSLSALQARRLGETLQAAASGGEASRGVLAAGRLVQDLEAEDPFAGIVAGAEPRPAEKPSSAPGAAARTEEDERRQHALERARVERERAVEAARGRVRALDDDVKQVRERAREAEVVALRAQGDAERARRAVVDAEGRLALARKELEKLDG
ncbi:MAG TPA: hypothetical protein VKU41_26855 [Polyangiaceae bacterium]|nr:hypothetical protein [Polyangiaceae bacterium]